MHLWKELAFNLKVDNISTRVFYDEIHRKSLKTWDIPAFPANYYQQIFVKIGTYRRWGRQDLVTQFLVKITFLYKLVAKKLDFVLSKLQISIWKDRATVAW